jgi:hypothetical protein
VWIETATVSDMKIKAAGHFCMYLEKGDSRAHVRIHENNSISGE